MKVKAKKSPLGILLGVISFFVSPFIFLQFFPFEKFLATTIFPLKLIEIVTILFILIGSYLYFKGKPERNRNIIGPVLLGSIISLLLFYAVLTFAFFGNAIRFTNKVIQREKEFAQEQHKYVPLITTIFDKAQYVNVRSDIDAAYGKLLEYSTVTISEGITYRTVAVGRKPIYFIRLKNGKIEKLFQSGEIKYETIDTEGEREVEKMLHGKKSTTSFPQHTCCGGDDVSWSQMPLFRLFVPERTYLKDFSVELEEILLIKDKNGKILGAMVDLYGD